MKEKELWPGGILYAGDSVGTDSLALADFARTPKARRGCDLGCGSGILLLLLAGENDRLRMDGVELRPEAAARCRENIDANGFAGRCRVWTADLRRAALKPGDMDLVVSNPPYFSVGSGAPSADAERAAMRAESATLPELCASAARLLHPGGDFCLVHRAERLAEVFAALNAAGLEPKRLRFLAPAPERAPTLFLCRARKGARPGLTVEAPLCQFGADGAETAEYRTICHWAKGGTASDRRPPKEDRS